MQKEELKTLVKKYFNLTENNTSENNAEIKAESFDHLQMLITFMMSMTTGFIGTYLLKTK